MPQRRKLTIRLICVTALVGLSFHLWGLFHLGGIDYSETLATRYTNRGIDKVVVTEWAEFPRLIPMVHVVGKPICPGQVGNFLTLKGAITYEYGMMASGYFDRIDATTSQSTPQDSTGISALIPHLPSEYTNLKRDTINGFVVELAESEEGLGMFIPLQGDMEWALSIYASAAVQHYKDELLTMVTQAHYFPERSR